MRKYPVIIALLIAIPFIQPIHAASNKNLQLRIDRLERMLENNSQYQLLAKIKQLKEENREDGCWIIDINLPNKYKYLLDDVDVLKD